MKTFDNKTIEELYNFLNELRRKFKEKIKTTSNIMIAINDTGYLTIYFYAHFNQNVYDSSRIISPREIMSINVDSDKLIDIFIDAAARAIRVKVREAEEAKRNEH